MPQSELVSVMMKKGPLTITGVGDTRVKVKDEWACLLISTPCRTVMDASSKTPLLANGEGGRCLNDATMKGKVDTLDLLRMLLRFQINQVGFSGDLKQFYPSIALHPSQWNLQRVLWREGLSFDSPIEEIVILTLIFGVRAVSALTEKALIMLAEFVEKMNVRLAELLKDDRFVDEKVRKMTRLLIP